MTNYFIPQSEKIDLSQMQSASDVVFELSTILENEQYKNKKIRVDLGAVELDQAQLLSIKSLIQSVNSEMLSIATISSKTEFAALNTGIIVSNIEESQQQESLEEKIEEEKAVVYEPQEPVNEVAEEPEQQEQEIVKQEAPAKPETRAEKIIRELQEEAHEATVKILETATKSQQEEYDFEKALEDILEDDEKNEKPVIDELEKAETLYIKRTLRSGQTASFDGNVVVIGDAHSGSEIIATGDISVWGVLSGIAHAGAKGNAKAAIRALKLNAIQLRIAGYYSRKPDAGEVVFSPKGGGCKPEEARITNGMVTIYTTTI